MPVDLVPAPACDGIRKSYSALRELSNNFVVVSFCQYLLINVWDIRISPSGINIISQLYAIDTCILDGIKTASSGEKFHDRRSIVAANMQHKGGFALYIYRAFA